MAAFDPGTILVDRFEISGVLGRGGTATVYMATDRLRGEPVALKILHAHLAACLQTGTVCSYEPEYPTRWETGAAAD